MLLIAYISDYISLTVLDNQTQQFFLCACFCLKHLEKGLSKKKIEKLFNPQI
jgi:hypothetical protein